MQGKSSWNGTLWGAVVGAVKVTFKRHGNHLAGEFLLDEAGFGEVSAHIAGTCDDTGKIEAELSGFKTSPPAQNLPDKGALKAQFNATGPTISGQWTTDTGFNGHLILIRTESDLSVPIVAAQNVHQSSTQPPLPLVTNTVNVGAVRLDSTGIRNLAKIACDGMDVRQPAINATDKGREYIHIGVDPLLADPALPSYVDTVLISAQEPNTKLNHRTVVIRLVQNGQNTIFVSGWDRIWVEGKAHQIELLLQSYQNKILGFWRRHGGNLNGIVFFALLGLLPSIPRLRDRFIVIVVTFVFLNLLRLTWSKVSNTRVFLHERMVPAYIKYSEYIIGPLVAIFSAIIAVLIQHYVHPAR